MKIKWMLSGSAAVAAMAGITVTVANRPAAGVAFIPPAQVAGNLCGPKNVFAQRRLSFMSAAAAYAGEEMDPASGGTLSAETLANIGYEISTDNPDVQTAFNEGLAHSFNFNHAAGIEAFRKAEAADPDCAMCYWGEAYALGPNINLPMDEPSAEAALIAVGKAVALKDGASEKERLLIDALALRYSDAPDADRAALDVAFADAMEEVAAAYPDDDFITVLSAEANMDTQPWDYWEIDGRTPKGRAGKTLSLLETVLARNPEYPPAIHLYIHTVEASTDPYRASAYADQLAVKIPELAHLVHMPTHIYYRTGNWKKSIGHNIDAVAADEAFLAAHEASPIYEYGYYPHNLHFLLTSAQMGGNRELAIQSAEKLSAKLPMDMAADAAWVELIKAAPYFAHAQFSTPETVLALTAPPEDLTFLKAMWHYARGEAYGKLGEAEKAEAEAAAIASIAAENDFTLMYQGGVPAGDVLDIARLTVLARAAAAGGDYVTAIEAMEEAVALQDSLPYLEPPIWYYPSRQTLAAMVLRNGDAARARQLFYEALVASPNNAYALYGLAESYRAEKNKAGAKYADQLFREAWLGDRKDKPTLASL